MYAIVETGGRQVRVQAGKVVKVEKLIGEIGSVIELSKVCLVQGEQGIVIGQPLVVGARVLAEVVRQGRERSITVFKKQRRKNYRRTRGHRQSYTEIRVTGIETK